MNFSWILFDADHTLFDFDRSSKAALEQTLTEHDIAVTEAHWPTYYRINKQCWNDYENGKIDRATLRFVRFKLFFESIEHEHGDLEDFNVRYLDKLPSFPFFMEGAIEILDRVSPNHRLGMITNGMKEVQRARLEGCGLDRYFDVIVISGEIGVGKPSAEYFEHVHDAMQRPPKQEVLVVGDSLNADIKGGNDFGFRTCWYNPGRTEGSDQIVPDYEIALLTDLPTLL